MTRAEHLAAVAARIEATPRHLRDLDPLVDQVAKRRDVLRARWREEWHRKAEKRKQERKAMLEARRAVVTAKARTRCECPCGRSWAGNAQPNRRWFERKCAARVRRAKERAFAVVAGWAQRDAAVRAAWEGAA